MASSSSSFIPPRKYDVFLSFSGEDTRNNFTSHLYSGLCGKQIQTFIDTQLTRGDEISMSLVKAIEGSDISIVIFSEKYPSSRWCLDELVKILECKNKYGQIVIPVFYHVDPSHVRKQTKNFGKSFLELKERFQDKLDKVESWRTALRETSNLSGFNIQADRNESELIKDIVNNVWDKLNSKFDSNDDDHLIGAESVIEEIESVLSCNSTSRVYSVGLWGIGGIGKTTIAKALYRKMRRCFEGSCFIENVREQEEKNKGLDHLSGQLFSKSLEDAKVNIDISENDYNVKRLGRKKVLAVFDDVNHFKQIESFIGSLNSFGEGSRIIITSRDRQVLENCSVDEIIEVRELSPNDALKLFSQYSFREIRPQLGFEELSNKIIEYARGLPLALKTLGCFLFKREKEEWESAIEKLKRIPNEDIQKVLQISYDGLNDIEKNIFLDIACFFKEENKDSTMKFLDACGFYPQIGIRVLVDKCLITISYNRITMHDLLQDMGREIVRQESIDDPGRRSRLWHYEDIYKVLTYDRGTDTIQGISLNMSKIGKMHLNPGTFTKMHKLRFLNFYGENKCNLSHFRGPVFTEVKYFHWCGYPLKSLPSSIHLENLVSLGLPHSNIQQLWEPSNKHFAVLDPRHCKCLKRLPPIIHLESLEELILSGCSNLKRLSEISACNLKRLLLDGTAIRELPLSKYLSGLVTLNLQCCSRLKQLPRSIYGLHNLRDLDMSDCGIIEIPESLGQLFSLKKLHLENNNFERIPESIINLSKLEVLGISKCKRLRHLPKLPCSIYHMKASDCTSLEALSDLSISESLKILCFSDCSNLKRLLEISTCNMEVLYLDGTAIRELPPSINYLSRLVSLNLQRCSRLKQLPRSLHGLHNLRGLNMSDCGITEIPESLGQLFCLETLFLENNNFERIPESIINLSKLKVLGISKCKRLRYLPKLPCSLNEMVANDCTSLEALSGLSILFIAWRSFFYYQIIELKNCYKLDGNELKVIVEDSLQRIQFIATTRRKPNQVYNRERHFGIICYPGSEIPGWFQFQSMGSSIILPQGWFNNKYIGFAFSVQIAFEDHRSSGKFFHLLCKWKANFEDCQWRHHDLISPKVIRYVDSGHVYLIYHFPLFKLGQEHLYNNELLIQFSVMDYTSIVDYYFGKENDIECYEVVKKCGIHFIYDQDFGESKKLQR